MKILAVRSSDVAACQPFVFQIPWSWPSNQPPTSVHVVRAVGFLESPLSLPSPATNLAIPNEPWACIDRGPLVGDGGYMFYVWGQNQRRETRWLSVVLLAHQGQNRHFQSHFVLPALAVRVWRPLLRRRVRGFSGVPGHGGSAFLPWRGRGRGGFFSPFLIHPLQVPFVFFPSNPSRRC
jgi:hypothetical protein